MKKKNASDFSWNYSCKYYTSDLKMERKKNIKFCSFNQNFMFGLFPQLVSVRGIFQSTGAWDEITGSNEVGTMRIGVGERLEPGHRAIGRRKQDRVCWNKVSTLKTLWKNSSIEKRRSTCSIFLRGTFFPHICIYGPPWRIRIRSKDTQGEYYLSAHPVNRKRPIIHARSTRPAEYDPLDLDK